MLSRSRAVFVVRSRSWPQHQKFVHNIISITRKQFVRACSTRANDISSSSTGSHSSSSSSTSSSSAMVSVDITKNNFNEVLPAVKQALERCTFFAVDCEMTGLHTDGAKHEFLDDHQTRYSKIADSSKNFIITQYGISCFEQTGPHTYEASTFNFFVFPQPHGNYCRKFLCDASSLAFLSDHGFDFNTCIGQGVPYMPLRTRDWQLMQVDRASEPREPAAASSAEDQQFIQDLIQLVTDWLAGKNIQDSLLHIHGGLSTDEENGMLSADENVPAAAAAAGAQANGVKEQQEQLVLVPLNSFRRLLAFQELRKPQFGVQGHPGFYTTKAEGDSRCIVLVRATAQQAETYEAQQRADKIARIHAAAGFAAVFDAMRTSNKPCVGHNCMFDISYGLFSFADSYLPATWNDYKKMVRSWHRGGIFDTKYLARRLPEVFEDTGLSSVYGTTSQPTEQQVEQMQALLDQASAAAGSTVQLPVITHAPGFDKYKDLAPGEAAHEAGYDAFMTGASFAALLPLVAGKVASDPTHELAVAHSEALQRAAEAAQATPGQPAPTPSPYYPMVKGLIPQPALQQSQAAAATPDAQQPNGNAAQQQPNGSATEQQQEQQTLPEPAPQQQLQQAPSLLSYVSGVVGRLNLTFSDMPYAALWGDDPIPDRPETFHLAGLQEGYRLDDVWRLLRKQGLGSPRITPVDSSSCLVTFGPEQAAAAPAAVAEMGVDLRLTPWAEYAAARYSRRLPEAPEEDGAAAMNVGGGAAGGTGVAARAAANGRRAAKRPRTALEADSGEQQQQQQRSCVIM